MKRFRLIIFSGLVLLTAACANRKLDTQDISYLFMDYDSYAPGNIGTPVKGTVSAQMKSGEIRPLKNNQGFSSSDNIHVRVADEEFSVYTRLNSFRTNCFPVVLSYTDKDNNTITSNDTVCLNFRGDAAFYGHNVNGNNGAKGSDGGTALLFRYGNDGNPGSWGENGADAHDLEIHVWRSGDTTFFHVEDVVTRHESRFITIGDAKLTIEAFGGNGGSGGEGGKGGDGKKGEEANGKTKLPGAGGRGGQGGQGGNGGRGANVTLVIHNQGGNGGSGGKGGAGGKAGTALAGQSAAQDGQAGQAGASGFRGAGGQTFRLVQEFDLSKYN